MRVLSAHTLPPWSASLVSSMLLIGLYSAAVMSVVDACVNSLPPGTHLVTLKVGGGGGDNVPGSINGTRQFLAVVPAGLPPTARVPLVVDIHGYSESPYYQERLVGLSETLTKYRWLGALPFGTAPKPRAGAGGCCADNVTAAECEKGDLLDKNNACSFNAGGCCGVAPTEEVDDVQFMREIVKWFDEKMCADTDNVFATGFSNGAMMANRLGCQASTVFKAIAPVAGNVRTSAARNFPACRPTSPVSWISFCGDRDSACNANFWDTFRDWANHNGCNGAASISFESATTKCMMHPDCAKGTIVEGCEITGLDHEWPGRPRPDGTSPEQPASNIDATSYMFDKFSFLASQGK